MKKMDVAIIGPGNIGIDLMMKIAKTDNLNLVMVAGVADGSVGLSIAKERGVKTTTEGIAGLMNSAIPFDLVFDCTSAGAHLRHAPVFRERGIFVVDLTPAGLGPMVSPKINLMEVVSKKNEDRNVNMITCGGQAMTPLAYAVQRVTSVRYAEMVTGAAAEAVGPGGRLNSNEFKITTRNALLKLAGVESAKVINIINPAVPPAIMRNTLYAVCDLERFDEIVASVNDMVMEMQTYVPGYRLKIPPRIVDDHIVVMNEVEGSCDYLPGYAGNLDIITAGAIEVAKAYADMHLKGDPSI
jgi:acetaldehyde dehydrogenase